MTELNFHKGRIESLLQQLSGKSQFTEKSWRFCVQNINKQSGLFQALNSLKNISKRSCLHPKRKKNLKASDKKQFNSIQSITGGALQCAL